MDETNTCGASDNAGAAGACALSMSEEEMEPIEIPEVKKNQDINVFEEESPSKEKNNFLLDNSRKINKPTVDLVFHRNNLAAELPKEDEDQEDKEDDITIAKMTAFVNQNSS